MTQRYKKLFLSGFCLLFALFVVQAQTTIKGKVLDAETGEELIGAAVAVVSGGTGGAITNYEGDFSVKVERFPARLKFSYTGFQTQEIDVSDQFQKIVVKLETGAILIEETVIKGQRIDDKQKAAPLTVENLDAIAIKETPAISFYNALGNLKGVDLTTASLGFTVINMRGFNSTSPVRSLQIIDGVDNQAPGLNFSLGNFLGASDLDVNKVDLVVGASSSFYGPNAFNGVISMETKNPFIHKGLSVSLKAGERDLLEGAFRWADAIKNKAGKDFFAYKINFFGLRANDWVADNYDPVTGTEGNPAFDAAVNPGRSNGVNTYGDETRTFYTSTFDARAGLNSYHRSGYREVDLVDYDTRNIKTSAAFHFRTNPNKEFDSPEIIIASNFGTGTTVYQGDNRFSLRNILFFQNRLEFRKKDKFFIRAYATNEDAGNSYDPYFTALQMQSASKTLEAWNQAYEDWWTKNNLGNVFNRMKEKGYMFDSNVENMLQWQRDNADWLSQQHKLAEAYANGRSDSDEIPFFAPGTARFDSLFNAIISRKNNSSEGGTLFYDKSALYHAHGEYKFTPSFLKQWVVGANVRLYRPVSDGTIFSDSMGRVIKNSEWGAYTGIEKDLGDFKLAGTVRVDKNQNFNLLATPSASVVWAPSPNNYLRFSFASAIRNPTLTDQYLHLRVGPATLIGNLDGFQRLASLESFERLRNGLGQLEYIDIAPIRPEKVKTFELGYRTTLFDRLYVDAGYYYNFYNDFIGFNIGVTVPFDTVEIPFVGTVISPRLRDTKAWRVASNAQDRVTSQGFTIGMNYYFGQYYMVQGNYSWNKLNTRTDDPIVPAFNTPEHKFNFGLSARDIPLRGRNKLGFTVNYKWIEGFVFEGSPQFTGNIPTYDLLDGQVNMVVPRLNATFKLGASNILNNRQFQTYGGPRIGRMAYVSFVYEFKKK